MLVRDEISPQDIIEMAREALEQEPREDWNSYAWVFGDETLKAFAKLVAAKERQACAKVCGRLADEALVVGDEDAVMCFEEAEDAIRARGEK